MGADLITLDEYKLVENINGTQYDDKLDSLITGVSQLVKTYCGTNFVDNVASPGITELHDIMWDSYVVQLRETPVIDITGVFERTSQSVDYVEIFRDGINGEYSWSFDPVSESVFRTLESGCFKNWPKGVGSVKVEYTAGYLTIPDDLRLAVIDIVTYYHQDEHKARMTIGTSTRESYITSSIRGDTGFPDHIKRVLDLYRVL